MKGLLPTEGITFLVVVVGILVAIYAFLDWYAVYGVKISLFTDISRIYKFAFTSSQIKQYLDIALSNSFLQSSYFLGSRGGHSDLSNVQSYNCVPYWRVFETTNYPDVKEKLQDMTLDMLNDYTSKLAYPGIFIPSYRQIEVTKNSGTNIKAINSGYLGFETPTSKALYDVTIEKNSDARTLTLFEIGKENFIDTDSIKNAIIQAAESMPENCRKIHYKECDECSPNVNVLLENACSDWETKLKNNIKVELLNLENGGDFDIDLEFADDDIKVKYESTCNPSCSIGDACSYYYDCKELDTCDETVCKSPKKCVNNKCCSESEKYYRETDCTYSYYGAASVLVRITDNSKKYVLYDSKEGLGLRNIQLKFYVFSGNYQIDPIPAEWMNVCS